VVTAARLLGHRMFLAPLARAGTVDHQREEAILRRGEGWQGLVGTPPQQGLRAPGGGTPQPPVVLRGEVARALPGQGLQVGPCARDAMSHHVVPVAKTGAKPPQALRHAARQTGQDHGPGLLGKT
jgi:hypothetical protein